MDYDGMIFKRAFLSKDALEVVLNEQLVSAGEDQSILGQLKGMAMCFFPEKGIQLDYTAAFHIDDDAVPENAKKWTHRTGRWPSKELKFKTRQMGVTLVPAGPDVANKSMWWSLTYDLNCIIYDKDYSSRINTKRILIILKDIKFGLNDISRCSHLLKSHFLKNALAWAMWERQEDREFLTNRDLLVSTLQKLYIAFEIKDMRDFFDSSKNILHGSLVRYKEVVQSNFSERIEGIKKDLHESINNLEGVLYKLYIRQLEFIDNQNENLFQNQTCVPPRKSTMLYYIDCVTSRLNNISRACWLDYFITLTSTTFYRTFPYSGRSGKPFISLRIFILILHRSTISTCIVLINFVSLHLYPVLIT